MDYRDERDALRGRVENLEQDLASANHELEERRRNQDPQRIAELEKQLAEARRKLDEVGSELARVKGGQSPAHAATVMSLVLAGVLVTAGAIGFVLVRAPAAPPPPTVRQPTMPRANAAPESPKPATTTAAPKPRTNARWTGSVTRASGMALAAGSACTIDATLEGGEHGVSAPELTVTCGGKALYRSTDALEGMSMYSSGANEEPGASAGTHVYALAYHDKGTRTGPRSEISLDTSAKAAVVWRESVPAWRVELAVAPTSAAVSGEPLAR